MATDAGPTVPASSSSRNAPALFRVSAAAAERIERDDAVSAIGAPLVPIARVVSRTLVALACGHAAPIPRAKRTPRALPCFACLDGRPVERDVVLTALADASPEDLAAYLDAIDSRAGVVAPPTFRSA